MWRGGSAMTQPDGERAAAAGRRRCGDESGRWVTPGLFLGVVGLFDRLLFDECLVLGDVGGDDATDVLDLVLFLVLLQLLLELHLLAPKGALGVGPQIGDL